MTRRSSWIRFSANTASLVFLVVGIASAQSYKVEKIAAAPPQELAPAVRDVLAGEALRVTGPNGPMCEIWLRKAVPAKASATQELGISFGQLAEGTLVGAVRFAVDVKDYRQQRVKSGVYTFRYALLPVDGNHQGVAPQRDFLIAGPAAADQDPASLSRDATLNLGRNTTGTSHPSVWSLVAVEGGSAALPGMTHQEDGDLWLVRFRVPIQSGSGVPSGAVMALVIVGHAPEA